jgi:glutamate formiminotransferase/formiminotetrahydrofolate cyclodeaminase
LEQKVKTNNEANNQISNWTIGEFLKKLSSDEPVPGGGSVSALSGALGAALIVMYCRIGVHRKGVSSDDQDVLRKIITEATSYEQKLNKLITEDSLAFGEVTEAYKLPKTTDEETKVRQAAIQKAFKKAVDAPFQTLSACVECLYLVREASVLGNPSAFSDLKVAQYLCHAGGRGAIENIEINIPYIKDADFVKQIVTRVASLKEALEKTAAESIIKPAH